MFLIKTVIQNVGETLFLRYNLLGDALVVYDKMKQRQKYTAGVTDAALMAEEFMDDHGVTALVPAYGVLFTQMLDLDKFAAADARQNVQGQLAMQKEVTRVQSGSGIIAAAPAPNGQFRQ